MMNSIHELTYLIMNNPDRKLCLEFALPYSNGERAETIVVDHKFIPEKLAYIQENYNEKLIGKRNNQVKIIKFYLK